MKRLFLVSAVVVGVLGTIIYINYPKLNLISGYAAKNMASGVFLAQREAEGLQRHDHDMPMINLANSWVSPEEKQATANVYGLMERKAVFKEGLGAVLVNGEHQAHAFELLPKRTKAKDSLPFPFGNAGVRDTLFAEVDHALLGHALDFAFEKPQQHKTRTVLVAYKNELLAERYAPGFGPETLILGWSATKSVWATLFGILEHQGKLRVGDAAFASDPDVSEEKKKITYDHLLRMQSGLAWEEEYFEISDVTKMLFLASDMTLGQRNNPVMAPPKEVWNYSSGTTNLLSGLLRERLGTHQAYLDFPYRELIDAIGMHSMTLETDLVGNYVASSYGWANTRDWAKFGLLYLNQGRWNGEQLFSETWAGYVATPTENSNGGYGAHFWLNAGGRFPNVPKDMYCAQGFQGQYVFIIPSKSLVVVRTGLAETPDFDVDTFLSKIIAALP
ncbi:serine hydrolase domain-containing protein [Maribacter sp. 2307ULW6-5]|uniref:serine hydrolase domain-containing protein n=1 Tax=Maribacter sp. 2307ULW6-5 TaxID=3386275 RepID=UPI0039BCA215